MPLDNEGFLRRECPTCEREFKWLPATGDDADDAVPPPDGGYFCPYCVIQAPGDAWFTQAQLDLAQNVLTREVVDPMLSDFSRRLGRAGGGSGLFRVTASHRRTDALDPLTESDDMTRVDFACHPGEPVKVLDNWDRAVHCLVCGTPAV